MAAEETLIHLLHLFDSFWFEAQVLEKNPNPPPFVFELKNEDDDDDDKPKLAPISTVHQTSELILTNSEESSSSGGSDNFLSPSSVLRSPNKLQTIFSGKDSGEEKQQDKKKVVNSSERINNDTKRRKRKRQKGLSSKSLSELEFEELKGFMDLGFVFSEEDKNSKLVEIIPGLQRYGEEEKRKISSDNSVAAATSRRPYLSQAWENMEFGRKAPEKKVELKINIKNEMDMKHQLKFWAHTVASAVK